MTVLLLLVLGTIADLGLLALLVGVSGFVFQGVNNTGADPTGVAVFATGVIACIAAPIAGFALRGRGKPGLGLLIAWIPPLAALLIASGLPERLFLR